MNSHDILTTFVSASVLGVILILLAGRLKVSAIVVLLVGGILAGPEFLGVVHPHALGEGLSTIISLAVALILFEGGLTLDVRGYRQVSAEIWGVLTRGVVVTWGLTAVTVRFVLGFDWTLSLLAASLVIVTGPTVIGPLLQRVRIRKNLHNILYWEGVLIDPIGVFIALLCYEWILSAGEPEAYLNFFSRFLVGAVIGLAFGEAVHLLLRKNLIPEERRNIFVLASALCNYAVADHLISESGLLSVTITGFMLGYKGTPRLERIIEYKLELKDFLIGLLFVLLAANLELADFTDYGTDFLVVVAVVMFVVRPANIFISTWQSRLSVREKLFLSWIAPRGIVAASMSSLFAFHLGSIGYNNADFLETFTYAVIAGTVIFQGFSARWVGSLLGVLEPKPKGWLIVGAHKLARAVATFIRDHGESVVLLDTNPREVKVARRGGLAAYCENAMTVDPLQHVELYGIGNILAITENEDLNHLICQRWQRLLTGARLYYWGYADTGEGEAVPGPERGMPVWKEIDIKAVLAGEVRREELVTCISKAPPGSYDGSGRLLMCLYEGEFHPEPPAEGEGEAVFLSLRPTELLSRSTKRDWLIFSSERTVEGLYREMLDLLAGDFPRLDREALLAELLRKEREFSSSIGKGISLPHTYTDGIDRSIFLVARLDEPCRCPHTGSEVSLVFLVLSPEDRPDEHLSLISRIAKLVMKDGVREAMLGAESPGDLYRIIEKGLG